MVRVRVHWGFTGVARHGQHLAVRGLSGPHTSYAVPYRLLDPVTLRIPSSQMSNMFLCAAAISFACFLLKEHLYDLALYMGKTQANSPHFSVI